MDSGWAEELSHFCMYLCMTAVGVSGPAPFTQQACSAHRQTITGNTQLNLGPSELREGPQICTMATDTQDVSTHLDRSHSPDSKLMLHCTGTPHELLSLLHATALEATLIATLMPLAA